MVGLSGGAASLLGGSVAFFGGLRQRLTRYVTHLTASEEQAAITCENASSTLLHPFLINCS